MLQGILRVTAKYKALTFILAVVVIGSGYFSYRYFKTDTGSTRYVLAQAKKGTLVSSVSGSGQVSVSDQIDVKAKVSGDILYVAVAGGQGVTEGQLLVQLDSRDAEKAVRDAEINLESAKLTLEKMKGLQGGDFALRGVKEKATDDLDKAYDDGFNTMSNSFLDLPNVIAGLKSLLYGNDFGGAQWNLDFYANSARDLDSRTETFKTGAVNGYQTAREKYDKAFTDYKAISRFSDRAKIEAMINETYDATKSLAESVKSASNLIQFYKDVLVSANLKTNSLADTHISTLSGYTDKTNTHLVALLAAKNALQTGKEAIGGADFDISSQELTVKQRENTLADAKEKLGDYYIRAPFGGVVAKIDLNKGESLSSGAAVATMITGQRIAEISLNEVDAAKIKIGNKATLTFDAVEGLSISGKVMSIDTLGTVSQGVVTYNVKIGFDTQDSRIKPGMSVTANIITDAKPDVLLVPNSAVKTQGGAHYVELPDSSEANPQNIGVATGVSLLLQLRRQDVETGLSNDESTEITSGLKEGDIVISRSITASATSAAAQPQSNNAFRIPGVGGGPRGR